MSRLNFQQRVEGHRVEPPSNRDLEQKLTYQQLLNLNHDLSKENQQLKNIASRLGQQLRNLHTQFDVRPRDQNNELYNAIGSHPILHQYQLTLIPLLDAYQAKIQEFENGFETINEEFINLQKKYIEVSSQNERLRTDLTDKIKQLVQVYQTGSSQKLGADFSQIILSQVSEKQKYLIEQNNRLERDFQKYKSQSEKLSRQLTESKRRQQEVSSQHKQLQINHRQAQSQLKSLKEQIFNGQMKTNELESQKKKLQNDIQRAMSQIAQLNKEKDAILKSYDAIKKNYERDISQAQQADSFRTQAWQKKPLEQTKQQFGDDSHKKLAKLQKQYDLVNRQKIKLKEQIQQKNIGLNDLTQKIGDLKRKIETAENQKRAAQMSQAKNRKLLEQFTQKNKKDSEKTRKQHQDEIKKIQDQYYLKIDAKQKKIAELQDILDKVKLQKEKIEQENILYTTISKDNSKIGRNKDSERAVQKLKQKLTINDQLFKEQLHILQNDNDYLKREAQNSKNQLKDKSQELRKLRQQLQKIKRELLQAEEKHYMIIEEIKRVKSEYEGSLKDKERLFQQKVKQIKSVIEESEKRRRSEREKVAQASRQYKRVLQEMRNTYQERIRVLEGEAGYRGKGC